MTFPNICQTAIAIPVGVTDAVTMIVKAGVFCALVAVAGLVAIAVVTLAVTEALVD